MSKNIPHASLVEAVMHAVAAFQDCTDQVDEAAAQRLGLNRTDLRCLGIVARAGAITAGQLAAAAHLSPGATTTVVDRLTRAGYARRVRDEQDRRRVTVEATPHANEQTEQIWKPIGQESYQRLSRRSATQLRVILAFLEEGQLLQTEHAARIRTGQAAAADEQR
jgi:DNA-binding MarR family transcriptional regulator